MMRKWSILSLFIVASMAFQSCTSEPRKATGTGGSAVAMAEAEQEDFIEYMRQRANCGELFRSIMESFEETCEIFDDYLGTDDVYMTMSFSGLREQLSSVSLTSDGGLDTY